MPRPPHALVVDDNEVNVALLEHLLKIAGYDVRTAASAELALATIEASVPDVLVTDVQLPGMDGLALVQTLRGQPATRALPILAVSAYAMPSDRTKALEAGCDEYVTKPIDTRKFAQVVAELLARR